VSIDLENGMMIMNSILVWLPQWWRFVLALSDHSRNYICYLLLSVRDKIFWLGGRSY